MRRLRHLASVFVALAAIESMSLSQTCFADVTYTYQSNTLKSAS
jgi:hypothetical protein